MRVRPCAQFAGPQAPLHSPLENFGITWDSDEDCEKASCPSSFCQKLSLHSLSRSTKTDLRLARRLFSLHYLTCCQTGTKVEAFHVPRSTIGLHTPGTGWPWRPIIHQLQRRRKKRERSRCFLCWGWSSKAHVARPSGTVAAAHCKPDSSKTWNFRKFRG